MEANFKMRVGGFNLNQLGHRKRESLFCVVKSERNTRWAGEGGIKGFQSERELGMLSFVALGSNNKKKVEGGREKSNTTGS